MVTNAAQAWGVLLGAVIIWSLAGVARHWREIVGERVPAAAQQIADAVRRAFPAPAGGAGAASVLADLGARGIGFALALGAGFGWAAGVDGWRLARRTARTALDRVGGVRLSPDAGDRPDATDDGSHDAPDAAGGGPTAGAPGPGGFDTTTARGGLFGRLGRRAAGLRPGPGQTGAPGSSAPPRPTDWRDGDVADGEIVGDAPGAGPGRTDPGDVTDAQVVHDPAVDGIFPRPAHAIPPLHIPLIQIGASVSSELAPAIAETYSEVMSAASRSAERATEISGQAGRHAAIATNRAGSAAARAQALQALASSASQAAAAWAASTQNAAERGVDQASVGAMADSVQVYQAMAAKAAQAAELSNQIAQAEAMLAALMPGVQGDAENAAQVAGQVRATLGDHQGGFREETARVGHGSADHEFLLA